MKMHAKEIIKNKTDKMVDLIIDEIGPEGEKKLNASFTDKKTKVKYIISLKIESGTPDILLDPIDDEEIPEKIQNILERLVALEIKEDADTIYDDSGIKARLTILENKEDNDTVYDDTDIQERLSALEEKVNNQWLLWV